MKKQKEPVNNVLSYSAPVEEAYRTLRTNIQFCGIDSRVKTLTITSCTPGEGKTTTAINLAVFAAKANMNVLLVDCDLRKPVIGKRLGLKRKKGFTNFISGYAELDEILHASSIPNLSVIPCGPIPPNPSEVLASKAFTAFLKNMNEFYELIILDTPPLGGIIDAALIASKTDGTMLVMQSGAVEFKMAEQVKAQLEQANANLLGVVMNRMKKKDFGRYYYYYSYYYSHDHDRVPV